MWARTTLSNPPPWLRKGTRASFGSYPVHRGQLGWTTNSYLREVSVLSSAHEPVESRAHVALLERTAAPAKRADRAPAGEEVIYGGQMIRRPGIGQVLGVR